MERKASVGQEFHYSIEHSGRIPERSGCRLAEKHDFLFQRVHYQFARCRFRKLPIPLPATGRCHPFLSVYPLCSQRQRKPRGKPRAICIQPSQRPDQTQPDVLLHRSLYRDHRFRGVGGAGSPGGPDRCRDRLQCRPYFQSRFQAVGPLRAYSAHRLPAWSLPWKY